MLQLCSVLGVVPLLAWISISIVLSSLFVFLPLLWLFVTAPLALVASIEISRAFVEMALSLVRTRPGWLLFAAVLFPDRDLVGRSFCCWVGNGAGGGGAGGVGGAGGAGGGGGG